MMTQHTELELSVKMYLHQDITNARAMLASLRGPLLSAILLACKAFTHEKRIGVAVREQQNWMWLGDGQSKNKIIELVHSMAKESEEAVRELKAVLPILDATLDLLGRVENKTEHLNTSFHCVPSNIEDMHLESMLDHEEMNGIPDDVSDKMMPAKPTMETRNGPPLSDHQGALETEQASPGVVVHPSTSDAHPACESAPARSPGAVLPVPLSAAGTSADSISCALTPAFSDEKLHGSQATGLEGAHGSSQAQEKPEGFGGAPQTDPREQDPASAVAAKGSHENSDAARSQHGGEDWGPQATDRENSDSADSDHDSPRVFSSSLKLSPTRRNKSAGHTPRFARRGMQDGCAAVREESDSDTSKEAMQIDSPHPRHRQTSEDIEEDQSADYFFPLQYDDEYFDCPQASVKPERPGAGKANRLQNPQLRLSVPRSLGGDRAPGSPLTVTRSENDLDALNMVLEERGLMGSSYPPQDVPPTRMRGSAVMTEAGSATGERRRPIGKRVTWAPGLIAPQGSGTRGEDVGSFFSILKKPGMGRTGS